MGTPPLAHREALVVAGVVEHDHQGLAGGNRLEEL